MNLRAFLRPLMIGGIYLLLVLVCENAYPHGFGTGGVGPWLPVGLGLGLLALLGLGYAPLVFASGVAFSWLALPGVPFWILLVWPALVTAEIAVAARGLRGFLGKPPAITRTRELGQVLLLMLGVSLLAALLGVWILGLADLPGVIPGSDLFLSLAVGHLGGFLVAGFPVLLGFRGLVGQAQDRLFFWRLPFSFWENFGQLLTLGLCVFLAVFYAPISVAHLFVLMPVLWIAIRHGLFGASIAVLIMEATKWYWLPHLGQSVLNLHLFGLQDILISIIALTVGAVVSSKENYQAQIESRFRILEQALKGGQLGFWTWDGASGMDLDAAWLGLLGYGPADFDGRDASWRKLVHPEDLSHVLWLRDAHWKGHSPALEAEYRVQASDGAWRWVLDRGLVVKKLPNGRPMVMAGACFDITTRKQTEFALQGLVEIMDSASDYIGALDTQGSMLYGNLALMRLCNDTDQAAVRRRYVSEYFSEAGSREVLSEGLPLALARGGWSTETRLRGSSGLEIPVSLQIVVHKDSTGKPKLFSLFARDIGPMLEKRRREQETTDFHQQVRKFESIGGLAGGIAHDFNNLLTAMLGSASLARLGMPADAPALIYFKQVESAALRAAEICQFLHMYSGRGEANPSPTRLNDLMRQVESGLRLLCGNRGDLIVELDERLGEELIDGPLFVRTCRHLLRNSLEACSEARALITIRTGIIDLAEGDLKSPVTPAGVLAGSYGFLEVADEGPGFPPLALDHLYEPFFSTKPGHQGLGLATAVAAMRAHNGAVQLKSEAGKGVSVRLLFPRDKTSEPLPSVEPHTAPEWRSAGRVLVVDDEAAVRMVAIHMLESIGFIPLVATNGAESLRIVRQHVGSLRAVLLDLTMPEMEGEQVYAEIRRIDAEVPIIIMSGFSEHEIVERFKDRELAGTLHKPFKMETLRDLMHKVLANRAN